MQSVIFDKFGLLQENIQSLLAIKDVNGNNCCLCCPWSEAFMATYYSEVFSGNRKCQYRVSVRHFRDCFQLHHQCANMTLIISTPDEDRDISETLNTKSTLHSWLLKKTSLIYCLFWESKADQNSLCGFNTAVLTSDTVNKALQRVKYEVKCNLLPV
jgi:hypothetical protein